jgi:hypothetical protein
MVSIVTGPGGALNEIAIMAPVSRVVINIERVSLFRRLKSASGKENVLKHVLTCLRFQPTNTRGAVLPFIRRAKQKRLPPMVYMDSEGVLASTTIFG